jgi:hypothetical protein
MFSTESPPLNVLQHGFDSEHTPSNGRPARPYRSSGMRPFAKIAIALAFVLAIVWFGHHSHPHNYGYAAPHFGTTVRAIA